MKQITIAVLAGVLGFGAMTAVAEEAERRTVEALYQDRATLAGQMVLVQGTVVKVNNGIMGRNFLHVQDGTGEKGTNDLTLTSQETANVGDKVTVTGRVVVDKDFGAGYTYPLLLEEAVIAK